MLLDQVHILAEGIPDVNTSVDVSGYEKYLYTGVAALILIGIIVAILRRIPWWVYVGILIVGAVIFGVVKTH